MASPAAAAGCWDDLATKTAEMSVTETFQATMSCMTEQGQRIDELQAARNAALERAEDLEEQIRAINSVFSDAVLTFNRSEPELVCPPGWSLFKEAGGRFIVGAGRHDNDGLTEYPSFKDDPERATGGAEEVTLTEPQMPKHSHSVKRLRLEGSGNASGLAKGGQTSEPEPVGSTTMGENQPHTSMPPYIALYFCKKD